MADRSEIREDAERALSGWRDIASAPRDGTVLLGWETDLTMPQGGYYIVMWWEESVWARDGDDTYLIAYPALWQPLPTPPTSPHPSASEQEG